MEIKLDDLSHPAIYALLQEHHQDMRQHSPEESVHALNIDALKAPGVSFYTAWVDGEMAGCGAIQQLDESHGEIKSMRTAKQHLRKGVAAEILSVLLDHAKTSGFTRVSLETGSPDAFVPARKMYERFGFEYCGPFANYVEDPYSVFMTKVL